MNPTAVQPSGNCVPTALATLGVVTCVHSIRGAENIEVVHLALGCGMKAQVITRIGEFGPDDFAVYIRAGAVVPQTDPFEFVWGPYLHENGGRTQDRRRRIGERRYLGLASEGLVMQIEDFPTFNEFHREHGDWASLVGADIAPQVGIKKYTPVVTQATKKPKSKKRNPRFSKQVQGIPAAIEQALEIFPVSDAEVHTFLSGMTGGPLPAKGTTAPYSKLEALLARVLIFRIAFGG